MYEILFATIGSSTGLGKIVSIPSGDLLIKLYFIKSGNKYNNTLKS